VIRICKLRLQAKLIRLASWRRRNLHLRSDVMEDGVVIRSIFLGRWMFAMSRKAAPPPKPRIEPTWHKAPFFTL